MVEYMAEGPQPPEWFVSHWWGEPVSDFLACLEQHALDRGTGKHGADEMKAHVAAHKRYWNNRGTSAGAGADLRDLLPPIAMGATYWVCESACARPACMCASVSVCVLY